MQYLLTGKNPVVIERWQGLLQEFSPEVVSVRDILQRSLSSDTVIFFHRSSLDEQQCQALYQLKQQRSNLLLLCCTDQPYEEEGLAALEAGANAYMNSYITSSLLQEVLAVVNRGDIWAGPELLQKLLRRLLHGRSENPVPKEAGAERRYQLSGREQQVFDVLVTGVSNKEIARQLDITERTVKAHVSSIFQKTGVSDRISLVLLAKQ